MKRCIQKYRKCAVLGCMDTTSSRHRFPHPQTKGDLFNEWVSKCKNSKLCNLQPDLVFRSYRVCDIHFKASDRRSNKLLKHDTVPTLCLPRKDDDPSSETLNQSLTFHNYIRHPSVLVQDYLEPRHGTNVHQPFKPSDVSLIASSHTVAPDYYWRDFNGTVPTDAFGQEDGVLVVQVLSNGYNYVGTYYIKKKVANIQVYEKKENHTKRFKILCTKEPDRFEWVWKEIGDITKDDLARSLVGGWLDCDIYIGRVLHDNEWKISKVYPPGHKLQGFYIWKSNGFGYKVPEFQLLMFKQQSIASYLISL